MRLLTSLSLLLATSLFLGCPMAIDPEQPPVVEFEQVDSLEALVTRTLDQNLEGRSLSTQTHGAWQILHGVLAYGRDFVMETPTGPAGAIDYILAGGAVNGFDPRPGDSFGDPPRVGLRMELEPSSKTGQGHRDQWFAILAQCDLPLETELKAGGRTYTFQDWLLQAEYDVPLNLQAEFSWTLIVLSYYRDSDYRWFARDRREYATESLLASELRQSLPSSACGGTHRLIGIAITLNQRRAEGKPIIGVWKDAEEYLDAYIEAARVNQNPDGSYSSAYLHRPGWTRDLGETLATTGHVLEFLSLAASDETLREPWVERSVRRLCQVLEQCQDIDIECGALYHALHGLIIYRSRLWG